MKLRLMVDAVLYERQLVFTRTRTDQEIQEIWGGGFSRGQTAERIRFDCYQPDTVITEGMYRPFDYRVMPWSRRSDYLLGCPRPALMPHMMTSNDMYFFNLSDPLAYQSEPLTQAENEAKDEHLLSVMGDWRVDDGELVRDESPGIVASYLFNHPVSGHWIRKLRADGVKYDDGLEIAYESCQPVSGVTALSHFPLLRLGSKEKQHHA